MIKGIERRYTDCSLEAGGAGMVPLQPCLNIAAKSARGYVGPPCSSPLRAIFIASSSSTRAIESNTLRLSERRKSRGWCAPQNRDVAKKDYEELQASGNAYVDALAVAVRNNRKTDFSAYSRDIDDDVKRLRGTVEPEVPASSFPSWVAPLITLAEKAFEIGVKYQADKRRAFATDLQTTCRWDDFDAVNPSPAP